MIKKIQTRGKTEQSEILGHFFCKALPFFFVLRLFHKTKRDDFPSLLIQSYLIACCSCLLHKLQCSRVGYFFKLNSILNLSLGSACSFSVRFLMSEVCLHQYKSALKTCCSGGPPSQHNYLYPSEGVILLCISSQIPLSCLHGCLLLQCLGWEREQ